MIFLFGLLLGSGIECRVYQPEDPNCKIKEYYFELTHGFENIDGKYKSVFLVNGTTPGPLIEGNEGDWIKLKVLNRLPVSVTLHFHGILQKGTPWSDGVAGITQYPILSGDSYTYLFQLTGEYGSSWYHAHFRGYLNDGLYGPIYIRPSEKRKRPYYLISNHTQDLELLLNLEKSPSTIMVSDQLKFTMDDVITRMFEYGIDPLCIQSIAVNGKGRITCHDSSIIAKLGQKRLQIQEQLPYDSMGCLRMEEEDYRETPIDHWSLEDSGYSIPCESTNSEYYIHYTENRTWQYLNVLNAGGQFAKAFSIDDHELYIIAVDGVFTQPVLTHQIIIPVGSRITVVFETKKESHEDRSRPFAIRFASTSTPQIIEGKALLVYGVEGSFQEQEIENFQSTKMNNGVQFQDIDGELNDGRYVLRWTQETAPFDNSDKLKNKGAADHTFSLYLNRTGLVEFSMFRDGTKLPSGMELSKPLLHSIYHMNKSEALGFQSGIEHNIRPGETYDIIINNNRKVSHPIHLHGHLFHLVSYSPNENFPYSSVHEAAQDNYKNLKLQDPALLDVAFIPPGGHAILRVLANNPGAWLIHCHNLSHLLGGMGAVIFESLDHMPPLPDYCLEQIHVNFSNNA